MRGIARRRRLLIRIAVAALLCAHCGTQSHGWELVDDYFDAQLVNPDRQLNGDLVNSGSLRGKQIYSGHDAYEDAWNNAASVVYSRSFNPSYGTAFPAVAGEWRQASSGPLGFDNLMPGLVTTMSVGGNVDSGTATPINFEGNIIGLITDIGELARFNVAFDSLLAKNRTFSRDARVVRRFVFTPDGQKELPPEAIRTETTFAAGARYFDLQSIFNWDGRGGMLGRTWSNTAMLSELGGPHAALTWKRASPSWSLFAGAEATLCLASAMGTQANGFGEPHSAEQVNSLLYLEPTYSTHSSFARGATTLLETNVGAAWQVKPQTSLSVKWSSFYANNLHAASEVVVYQIPDMGINVGQSQDLFQHTLLFSLEHSR